VTFSGVTRGGLDTQTPLKNVKNLKGAQKKFLRSIILNLRGYATGDLIEPLGHASVKHREC